MPDRRVAAGKKPTPDEIINMAKTKIAATAAINITTAILVLRRQRVILDRDLAALYGVTTKHLNQAIKRNAARFPHDFMFRLTTREASVLRSQIVTSKQTSTDGRGGARHLPFVFTEHGAIQAANVLNSPRAVEMGVHVVRAFVRLRELLASNQELAKRLDQLEARIEKRLLTHDEAITAILSAIRELMNPPEP
ncbi:MAG: ORF6N domain-containing protein, partial [Nevskiaceae bacterium]|nr:ORF6N domain-containing protein [Nevskiaceae bacterium]